MIKRFIIAIVLLAVVVGGIVGFNLFRDQAIEQYFATMEAPTLAVSTVKVEPGPWAPGLEALGTVAAARGVDLAVEATGIVKEIRFESNQRVEAGHVLIQLDDAVQRADLLVGQTQAALDQQALDRALELQKRGVGSEVTADSARAAASTSATQVTKLQAVLDQKQLKAPFSGTLGIPKVEVGQYLAPGTVVATLQDLDTMRTDFSVPEQQLGALRIGQPVSFGLTANEMAYRGTITGIEPKVDPSSRLVSVRAEVTNPQNQLSPGQFLQVRVELPKEDGVLSIPQTAVVSSLYGDFVYAVRPAEKKPAEATATADTVAADAKPSLAAAQVFVKTGRRIDGRVEIVEGIAAGDEIVTAGQNRLSNGTPVTVNNDVTPGDGNAGAVAK
ncbi:MAG: efflux RND transporter periplasmic adaptor subunit [Mesorhizobium sp.]|nr:efflux RND transporter periplasmic adaptor subunit [Mesorhizobium sp.]